MLESFFNTVTGLQACKLVKKQIPTQVFSCEYCKFFKSIYFEEYLQRAASEDKPNIIQLLKLRAEDDPNIGSQKKKTNLLLQRYRIKFYKLGNFCSAPLFKTMIIKTYGFEYLPYYFWKYLKQKVLYNHAILQIFQTKKNQLYASIRLMSRCRLTRVSSVFNQWRKQTVMLLLKHRSSLSQMFFKKDVLINFVIFTEWLPLKP